MSTKKTATKNTPRIVAASMILLCLAALYESWPVPFAVLLVVPLGVLGAIVATLAKGLDNGVYFQVGLLTTVGLAVKNAILIVEFAKTFYDSGAPLVEAAIKAAQERLRPILMNGNAYTLIHSMDQFDLLDGQNSVDGTGTGTTVSGYYALAEDLDASGTTYTSSVVKTFGGTFAGLGHTVDNLTISAASTNSIGLIGIASTGSVLRDIGLTDVDIEGGMYVGALIGSAPGVLTVTGAYSTGSLKGKSYVGGLIGRISGDASAESIISYCYSSVDVTANNSGNALGGLIGNLGVNIYVSHTHDRLVACPQGDGRRPGRCSYYRGFL